LETILICCLQAWLHVFWCLALLENGPVTLSTTAAWIALKAGLKQTTAFRMIAHFYCDLYQGVLGWFHSLASELELARSGAVHPSNSPMAWPWCQLQGAAPRPTDAHFTPSEKVVLEHFVVVEDGMGSHFMPLLQNALHLTLQARYLH
jgi:hypothetical protein